MTQRFYPVSARNWFTLESVQLQSGGRTASFIGSRSIYAPAEYSYHCQLVSSFRDALLVSNNTNQNTSEWMLNFIDFQVQLQRCIYILQQWIKRFFKNNSLTVSCFLFYDTDSGLRFGERNRFLLRQWLCRLLHRRDLDGAADLTALAVDFRVRSAHDHASKHHGSIRRPQRSIDFCTSVRVKHCKAHTSS